MEAVKYTKLVNNFDGPEYKNEPVSESQKVVLNQPKVFKELNFVEAEVSKPNTGSDLDFILAEEDSIFSVSKESCFMQVAKKANTLIYGTLAFSVKVNALALTKSLEGVSFIANGMGCDSVSTCLQNTANTADAAAQRHTSTLLEFSRSN